MKTGIIIQARTSSTRLPAKVLKTLPFESNITVLEQVVRRAKCSDMAHEVIIATTTDKEDDAILEIAEKEKVKYFRGSVEDVLSRYYFSAKENNLDVVVRVTSDCPCIDPEVINKCIKVHIDNNYDYTTNSLKRTYPHGLDTEVVSFRVLEKAFQNAGEIFEREHVTPYIYRSNPDKFKIKNVEAEEKLIGPDIRITLDTEEDYALLCCVYDNLYSDEKKFLAKDIIELFNKKPWLYFINKKIVQKKLFDSLDEEIEEAIKILALQDLKRAGNFLKEQYNENIHNNRRRNK